ncbi:hypothetical protein CR513_15324, partial [Mucuna pruriens]
MVEEESLGRRSLTCLSARSLHFLGNCKSNEYVDWELKVDQIEIRSDKRGPCEGWRDLKRLIRERFVPSSYIRDLHIKLQRLHQGPFSVEEYHKEMEMDLLRAQIKESEEVTMARFLHSLSKLVHQAIKVEMQLMRSASRKTYGGSSGWKGKEKENDRASREKSPKKGSESFIGQKELTPIPTSMPPRTSSIKCFKCLGKGPIASQCPNRSVMIVKDDGEIGSKSSIGEVGTSSESKSLSDGSHYEGNLLVVAYEYPC